MIRIALMIAAAATLAAPASAQREFDPDRMDKSQIGSRFKIAEEAMGSSDMRKFQKKAIKCTVSGDRDLARELLMNSDPATIDPRELSVDYGEMMDKMNFDRCMVRAMPRNARMMRVRIDPTVMRNLFAEEIYLYDNDDPPVIGEGAPEYLPARLADCIVYRAPVRAHEFLKTNPTSSGERKAAEALSPTVSECLPGEDSEVSFSLAQLRAYVADGLWSRSYYGSLPGGEVTVEGEDTE